MRVKDPSRANPEKNKRNKRPKRHQDEDSSDDIAGLTCQHVSQAVDVHHVKRAVAQNVWSICSECLKERRINDGDPVIPSDIWLCLKCGSQGCSQNSEGQHSLKHFQTARTEPHCIVINISTWIIWCYECDEELSTHCNKKVLAQIVDFLQKHVTRTEPSSSSKIIRLHEENSEGSEILKGKSSANGASVPVKGINNLGNTCFFNAVMQNLAQTHMLNELMYEMKEKGIKLKISQAEDAQLDPLVVNLSSPGPLTSAMFLFLHSMRETGKGPLSPKVLFSQLCQKAPRFKGLQQQDSQELLHYLLDAMRIEETKRIQAGILKAFNNPTTKTADEETKRKVKGNVFSAYGREGVKMNFIDRIFVGELTSTVMCEECENISTVKEPFIDLSLPIIEERVSKPVPLGRTSKCKNVQEADLGQFNCSSITAPNNQQPKITRRHSLTKDKNQLNHERSLARKSSSGEEERSPVIMHEKRKLEVEGGSGVLYSEAINAATESTANGSQTEGSEKEVSRSESSVDADSEASEGESAAKQEVTGRSSNASGLHVDGLNHLVNIRLPHSKPSDSNNEMITSAIAKLSFNSIVNESEEPISEDPSLSLSNNSVFSVEKSPLSQSPQNAFQTLSQSYITSSKECSVQSCLYQFTSVELLMGNNKLLCENCTERKQKYQKKTHTTEKKTEGLYTNARKQLLISAVPAILVLHLKRFHQAGLSLRKVNRHVDFPLILDLAPFCSASCKNITDAARVLYTLYGIVEHSGSMRGGHYAAYVKVRTPCKKLLEHIASNRNVQGLKEAVGASAGQWVYVSDVHVQMVPESRVLNSQAYLLFYERIL
ncbi:ubiquitin carboxyl-terminal hydrolase 45 isoform X1 [Chelonia mydas]|uniref:ubiquitin carboxyl-terminal hydrolase 45 isoform X1 n=1 Tax=Chelonia mydas TaxID=8469 RepID=UPI001CA8480E|nr:ubiquitin carboxyl-terminal hydrolase 45 isoform X1 [Chelonia mydas]XP_043398620.1 ubiquitin carboxyl-terminal hydrolase 45 isoform X1 [Chelonia mydas]XP_043398621.1 ubiquitin carboxyl-terminal hydrolase 45 isoform X1 [Chelonia mydas]XP_043398622.1 ubiquitin carboxyl-terminal hydrolase 45 isoform X1 [Chelonia mydas]XP_043398623.1 ubiquitin carboxyl-terminal hydrolase 45 isoform X1 [Chelonia mydas]XP_043398624.1 ubiquitin carboxyl-terminal hydrolase 45 isoform X1 [Chelonia mydas]XP_04339862